MTSGSSRPRKLVRANPGMRTARSRLPVWTVGSLAVLMLMQLTGVVGLVRDPVVGPEYTTATEYVAKYHSNGEPIIVAIPPPSFLVLGSKEDLIFLPGPMDSDRAQRYTRRLASDEYVDFWLGVPSIMSVGELCTVLDQQPPPWLIVDETRLDSEWAYAGQMADVIRGHTTVLFLGDGGVTARRGIERAQSSRDASDICAQSALNL